MADPKPIVEQASARHSLYGPSGTLLPAGPEFPLTPPATDLVGLPWKRYLGSEWTTLEQRDAVRAFLVQTFKQASPNYRTWAITERDYAPRSALRLSAPLLVLTVIAVKGKINTTINTAMEFPSEARHDLAKFRAVLAQAGAALAAEYAEL
jgi:hypothetical protein